jgi:hypothetical protein
MMAIAALLALLILVIGRRRIKNKVDASGHVFAAH